MYSFGLYVVEYNFLTHSSNITLALPISHFRLVSANCLIAFFSSQCKNSYAILFAEVEYSIHDLASLYKKGVVSNNKFDIILNSSDALVGAVTVTLSITVSHIVQYNWDDDKFFIVDHTNL